jgi:anti-sigma-K factor RskA
MNATGKEAPDGGDIEQLLPWHAAGTLSRRDAQRVEEALARDSELARRYELVREELGETIRLNETLGAPSSHAMEKLFARIDAEPARKAAMSPDLRTRITEFFAGLSPRTLAWSATAAVVAILFQAGFIANVIVKERPAAGYQTASAPVTTTGEGAYALIRFKPETNVADITKFLELNKLAIVGGPSGGGLYRVRIAAAATPKADLDQLVKKLQEDKIVSFIATTE